MKRIMETFNDFFARENTSTSKHLNIKDELLYNRAMEAVIWGMPAVNYDSVYLALLRDVKGSMNQVVYWSRFPDWKNQTLNPSPDTLYVMPLFDTRAAGPMVLEIPPTEEFTLTGSINDCWQTALESTVCAGKKYLILPPGYNYPVPNGYTLLYSDYYQGYALLRSSLKRGNGPDLAKAIAHANRIKLYPLFEAYTFPATVFVDAADVVFDATIPYDIGFFESLNRMIQHEPWLTRDKIMIDILKTIGIEKGKVFKPDVKTQKILTKAIVAARDWFNANFESAFPSYYEETNWTITVPFKDHDGAGTKFENSNKYSVGQRGLIYYACSSVSMFESNLFCLMSLKDKQNEYLQGNNNYKLSIPANIPANQCWSLAVYDSSTHAFVRNVSHSCRSSQTKEMRVNPDGTIDIYFSPKAPAGRESNWIPTGGSEKFEVCLRFYGPERELIDKTWKLPDIEHLKDNKEY